MVVEPEYQRQGLGTLILETLIATASDRGASIIVLNARVVKVGFYQKHGFQSIGEVFASPSTGLPHIKMRKKITL
jgi:predicted GNAT family N-acyltransferase